MLVVDSDYNQLEQSPQKLKKKQFGEEIELSALDLHLFFSLKSRTIEIQLTFF